MTNALHQLIYLSESIMINPMTVTIIIACGLSILLTPWVIQLAHRLGAIDQPQARKVHTHPIPRLGGVGVCISFAFSMMLAVILSPETFAAVLAGPHDGTLLVFSLFMVLGLGVWDDLHPINWSRKFLFQLGAGSLVYLAGLRIESISVPFGGGILELGLLAFPLTTLWVVGITNAFNLIDGLDGLASGVAMIASITIAGIALLSGDTMTATVAFILAGSVLGFLVYNFNPARIFLGDSGSLVLGFVLAVLSIHGSMKGTMAVSILVPLLALGLPVMDTLLAMLRRLLGSFLPDAHRVTGSGRLRAMFLPDKNHIHHQLLAHGFSHRNAVILLYLVSFAFGAAAFAVTSRSVDVSIMLVVLMSGVVLGVKLLGYREMALLQNGALLPLFESPIFTRKVLTRLLDLIFIACAFYASIELAAVTGIVGDAPVAGPMVISAACSIQFVIFLTSGLYKGTVRLVGLGDVVREAKAVAIAVLSSALLLFPFMHDTPFVHVLVLWVLDFYFLATCVIGARVSFQILNYQFRKQRPAATQVLIYGANALGLVTLQKILACDPPAVSPAGFLDEDSTLEGRMINGYPVYGGHWKLDGLLRKKRISEILLATDTLQPEVWNRVTAVAREHGVALRTTRIETADCVLEADTPMAPRSIESARRMRAYKSGRIVDSRFASASASI
jgi:UDP-GlcNAc:undecaprenyl-phosphate/decaprenyl-phosphate GlcNAc-1-phosphate transferase